jgi:cell wall-associated NlpC family hydrolase
MTFDKRLTPARPEIAAAFLKGQVEADRFSDGLRKQVIEGVIPLRSAPRGDAMLDTEVLYGETLTLYDEEEGWAFVQLERDGYCGHVPVAALFEPGPLPTHEVRNLRTFLYPVPSIKAPPVALLSMLSPLTIIGDEGEFLRTERGHYVIARHAGRLDAPLADPVAVAERFVGTPYLWGGRSSLGLDCSGLVQTALRACGIKAPRDTDMQEKALGQGIALDEAQKGDLVFWKGHVGMIGEAGSLIHANGFHMEVVKEPLDEAIRRIADKSFGAVTSVRRVLPAEGH